MRLSRRCPIKGLWEKILALFIGFLLWNYVVSQGYIEVTYLAPVEFRNLSSEYEIKGAPDSVKVKVRGAPWVIKRIMPGEIKVVVDMKGVRIKRKMIIYFDNVEVPTGVEVVSVKPEYARVYVVRIVKKKVPVVVKWRRSPSFKWKVSPSEVTVMGEDRLVSRINYVSTKPVDPDILANSTSIDVYLKVPYPEVKLDTQKVRLEVVR